MKKKNTAYRAFKELGKIDKMHESGKITKKQHDILSKRVLRRLTKQ